MRTPRGPALVAAAAIVAALGAWAPAAGAREGASPTGPPEADRDRDDVFDDLEPKLEGLGRGERIRVIVSLSAEPSPRRLARIEDDVGDLRTGRRLQIVNAFAADVTGPQARALARRRDVRAVEADSRVHALNDSARSSFGVTEARLDAPAIEGDADGDPSTYSPGDLVAAVIDTGIDPGHADLDEGKVLAFRDFVNGRSAAYDDDGHGTHVAGTLAGDGEGAFGGTFQGVAPGAGLVAAKVLDNNGSGLESDVVAAIEWVVDNRLALGIEAINLSIGSESNCSDGTDAGSRAVNMAHAAGLVVAVAAGNSGPGKCTVESPGAAEDAVTVGAMTDTTDPGPPDPDAVDTPGFSPAFFSSRGPTADGRIKPDVSAPGVAITSADAGTVNGYATADGTSSATPFVAGVALLMRDASPALSADDVKQRIMDTAVDWGRGGVDTLPASTGPDIEYGAGRLDAYAAIKAAGAAISSPPPVPDHRLIEDRLKNGERKSFNLTITDMSFPIAATLLLPTVSERNSTNPDFNVRLLDPTGAEVDRSAFTTRQDEVGHHPTVPGVYRLEVESALGSADFYLDVSASLAVADTTPPQTTIDSGPADPTTSTGATIAFHASEPGSSFECSLDAQPFAACTSPKQYTGLREGSHSFEVRATDSVNNTDPSPARGTWTIDTADPPPAGPPPPPPPEPPVPPPGNPQTSGSSRFAGTAADDCTVRGTPGSDVLDGGLGDDCLEGGDQSDTLAGGSGTDRLTGGAGTDTLSGGPGDDRLDGGADRDVASGDEGDDTIDGGPGSNIVDGGIGNDEITGGERVDSLNGGSDEDTIRGGDGGDGITGASGRDRLFGDDGDDRIEGGLGKDHIEGGDGDDNIVAIDGQTDTVECGRGRDVVRADGGDRIGRDCERVIARDDDASSSAAGAPAAAAGRRAGTAAGGNQVTGDGSAGELRGTPADDTIDSPVAGNLLLGLAGDDVLAGGSGDDEARGGDGEDIVSGGPGADVLLGGAARDLVSGGPGADRMDGQAGSNIMNGAVENDVLEGGERADSLNGGSDEDTIRGGDGDDGITGASGRDRLFGDDGDDRIEGGLGKDHIEGGDGGDNIVAADGQVDEIDCGRGRDVVRADGDDRIARDCELVIARRGNAYTVVRR